MRLTVLPARYAQIVDPGRLSTPVLHRKTQNARIAQGGTMKTIIHTLASIVPPAVVKNIPLSWNVSNHKSARVTAPGKQTV